MKKENITVAAAIIIMILAIGHFAYSLKDNFAPGIIEKDVDGTSGINPGNGLRKPDRPPAIPQPVNPPPQ
ncbi:hypothetical protein HYW82_03580 [Candidatus Peregrinibacteria bacterium]|nr:hypothetical protein [Candidatus Peregrinibacteria bacterium]